MTNINQIVQLYFEADRSAVKRRYEEIYGLIEDKENDAAASETSENEAGDDDSTESNSESNVPEHEKDSEESEQSEETLDDEFDEFLDFSRVKENLTSELIPRWLEFDDREKVVAFHYCLQLFRDYFSLAHVWEGMTVCFTPWQASGIMHALFPSDIFPVTAELALSELSYQDVRSILDMIGIHFDDSQKLRAFEVWRNLSVAVNSYRSEHKLEPWQMCALAFDLGPRLLPQLPALPVDLVPKVWFVATNDDFGEFESIDSHGPEVLGAWAINKRAKRGDIALMYCVSPRSAITSVYRIVEDAHFDPFGGWTGYRAKIAEKIAIPWIKFTEIKADSILKEWKLVKGNFQGLLQNEVPENCWLRLLEMISDRDPAAGERLSQFRNAGKGTREIKVAGEKWSEKEVEDRFAIPVLERIGWKIGTTMIQQVPMQIKVGSGKPKEVLADFVGYHGALTSQVLLVVEAK